MTNATRVEDGILRDAIAKLDAAHAKFKTEMERRSLIIEMDIGGYDSVLLINPEMDGYRDLDGYIYDLEELPPWMDVAALSLGELKIIRRLGRNRFRWNS